MAHRLAGFEVAFLALWLVASVGFAVRPGSEFWEAALLALSGITIAFGFMLALAVLI